MQTNYFLLLKKFKNTESAQLWWYSQVHHKYCWNYLPNEAGLSAQIASDNSSVQIVYVGNLGTISFSAKSISANTFVLALNCWLMLIGIGKKRVKRLNTLRKLFHVPMNVQQNVGKYNVETRVKQSLNTLNWRLKSQTLWNSNWLDWKYTYLIIYPDFLWLCLQVLLLSIFFYQMLNQNFRFQYT